MVLSWITYRVVENPLRYGVWGRAKALGLLMTLAAIGLGVFGLKQAGIDGMPLSPEDLALRNKVDAQFAWNHASNDLCIDRYQTDNAAEAKFS